MQLWRFSQRDNGGDWSCLHRHLLNLAHLQAPYSTLSLASFHLPFFSSLFSLCSASLLFYSPIFAFFPSNFPLIHAFLLIAFLLFRIRSCSFLTLSFQLITLFLFSLRVLRYFFPLVSPLFPLDTQFPPIIYLFCTFFTFFSLIFLLLFPSPYFSSYPPPFSLCFTFLLFFLLVVSHHKPVSLFPDSPFFVPVFPFLTISSLFHLCCSSYFLPKLFLCFPSFPVFNIPFSTKYV